MDTKNITNTLEKKSASRIIIDSLFENLEKTVIRENKLKSTIEALQELCDHEHKAYEGTTPNGTKIFNCVDCKKRFYE